MENMPKKMLIDATHAEETRVVVVDGNKVEEFDFESQFKRQLAGNIYLAKVTRVEPSLQAAFVDYGGNRHGFLAFSEIHPDYYQIPVADREALMAEEKAYAEAMRAEAEADAEKANTPTPKRRRRTRGKAAETQTNDAVITAEVETTEEFTSGDIAGMEMIDLGDDAEGNSPMVLVGETPVETPSNEDHDEFASEDDSEDDESLEDAGDDRDADSEIESVAEEDDTEDVRPVRKPRPKRYKIQEVIHVRQIMLIQVVKEERGNKGAALTTYLSLAGRYCVLMPNTARGGGISRKITNAADRKKLKEIASTLTVPDGAGLIIRTAGAQRTKAEIKRDYEYLQRMWEQIRELTLQSIAPAKIYEEGDLIKRSIRDLYSREIDEVIVAGDAGYRTAKDFMKMIMPSHAKNVKAYSDQLPLFARYQVEGYLNGMFNPTVQLPSGGYIVIGITEALVAIDVNSGRATKEGSIEQTALKTNLEAADEVARQLRLRDLAGLIVIDFIDMDERKNNAAVEKRFKDKLKTDRARIQVGRISGFGLLEMSRQRLRPGMLEATTQMCSHCHGTGLLRSDDNVALTILRTLEEEGVRGRSKEVLVRAPISIANFLMNGKREHIADIEARYGMSVRVESDPSLISPDYAIDKFKTATRFVPEAAPIAATVVTLGEDEDDIVEEIDDEDDAVEQQAAPQEGEGDDKPNKRKRRRRRRRRSGSGNGESQDAAGAQDDEETTEDSGEDTQDAAAEAEPDATDKPKRKRNRRRKSDASKRPENGQDDASENSETSEPEQAVEAEDTPEAAGEAPDAEAPDAEAKPKKRTRRKKAAPASEAAEAEVTADDASDVVAEKPKAKRRTRAKPSSKAAEPVTEDAASVEVADAPVQEQMPSEDVASVAAVEPVEVAAAEPAPSEPVVQDEAVATDTQPDEDATAEAPIEQAVEPETPAEVSSDESDDKPKRRGWWSVAR